MKSVAKLAAFSVLAALSMGSFAQSASACSADGKEGFAPRNSRYIPPRREILDSDGAPVEGGITEAEFNGVISSVEKFYNPIVKKMGGELRIERRWKDGTVNAYASREGNIWNVSMFGGLARHKETTIDGFMLVVCHEVGHHIGGAPKYNRGNVDEWASNEGESDFFATLKCARRVLANEANLAEMRLMDVPENVLRGCAAKFPVPNQAAICVRTAMGGLSLARLLADLNSAPMPDLGRIDPKQVPKTYDAHPEAQCRLDTYFAGSLCEKNFRDDVDQKDPVIGTCAQELGESIGVRPRCWYMPARSRPDTQPSEERRPPTALRSGIYW